MRRELERFQRIDVQMLVDPTGELRPEPRELWGWHLTRQGRSASPIGRLVVFIRTIGHLPQLSADGGAVHLRHRQSSDPADWHDRKRSLVAGERANLGGSEAQGERL